MTSLTQRKGKNSQRVEFYDSELEGGIPINDDSFGNLDRIYDVRGLNGIAVSLKNVDNANSISYLMDYAVKNYTDFNELTDSDFFNEVSETTINAGATSSLLELLRVTPKISASRIRLKETVSGQSATMTGTVSVS